MKTEELIKWLKTRVIVGEWDKWTKEEDEKFAAIIKRLEELEKLKDLLGVITEAVIHINNYLKQGARSVVLESEA